MRPSMDILRKRCAKDELSNEEFEQMKKDLLAKPDSAVR